MESQHGACRPCLYGTAGTPKTDTRRHHIPPRRHINGLCGGRRGVSCILQSTEEASIECRALVCTTTRCYSGLLPTRLDSTRLALSYAVLVLVVRLPLSSFDQQLQQHQKQQQQQQQ
mmetsp:Transcript_5514/g.12831  ORF Transcript_5514/g.12831 Transcript_5514/m.12831 type:complete len:117 (-) Transcript_5514:246-596(-)